MSVLQAHRKLHLVAVTQHGGGGDNGRHRLRAGELFLQRHLHLLLLCAALGFVGDVLINAAAAAPEDGTSRLAPVGGGGEQPFQTAVAVVLERLDHPHLAQVARRRVRHEKNVALLGAAHAGPVVRQAGDGQRAALIFFRRHGKPLLRMFL